MVKHPSFLSINDYLSYVSPEVRPILEEIRRVIKAAVPDAEEAISYQLPAFKQKHVFIYFAAFKKHIGIYPPVKNNNDLVKELVPYAGEKGNLKFPLNQPIPYVLIGQVAEALSKQYKV